MARTAKSAPKGKGDKKSEPTPKKKTKKKESVKEIMDAIIDKEALEERRRLAMPKKRSEVAKNTEDKPKSVPWYKQPISDADFIRAESPDKKAYARHKAWKESVWIGPYESKASLESVITEYVRNAKRNVLKRKSVKGLHSAVLSAEELEKLKILGQDNA